LSRLTWRPYAIYFTPLRFDVGTRRRGLQDDFHTSRAQSREKTGDNPVAEGHRLSGADFATQTPGKETTLSPLEGSKIETPKLGWVSDICLLLFEEA
jgi:hypothetical protein